MKDACIVAPDRDYLKNIVRETYTAVADDPATEFHFHVGLEYAVRLLGYDRAELESLPEIATSRFAGLGNPLAIGPIHPGETVVDLGSGAGMDLLLAARRVGRLGRVIGVDPTPAMRSTAWQAACEAGLAEQVWMLEGEVESIPLVDGVADVVISNGVLNLGVDKARVFREIARVLKPGGRACLADAVIDRPFGPATLSDPALWAS